MSGRSASATSSLSSSHIAMPVHVQPSTPIQTPTPTYTLPHRGACTNSSLRRGHMRSASLENANSFISKNTLGLPITNTMNTNSGPMTMVNQTGTLKSRNEQKRLRNKFGSHNNLEDYVQQGRTKFQNLRQMFEITKGSRSSKSSKQDKDAQMMQSLPPTLSVIPSETKAHMGPPTAPSIVPLAKPSRENQNQSQKQPQQPDGFPHPQLTRKPTPPTANSQITGCGNRNSISELNERLNITESREGAQNSINNSNHNNNNKGRPLKQPPTQLQQQQQQFQPNPSHSQSQSQSQASLQRQQSLQHQQIQMQKHQQMLLQSQQHQQQQQQQQRSASDSAHLQNEASENIDQTTNLLRPIAFKPIPFEPDYSIPNRYCNIDHYGSTPSLAPAQGPNMRFGSTTDLRHGSVGGVSNHNGTIVNSNGLVGVGGAGIVAGYSSNNYCNNLMARRRGSRSLKINDSMESIRHTPDSDTNSQSSTIKSNCGNHHLNSNYCNNNNNNNNNMNIINNNNNNNNNNNGNSNNHNNNMNKYLLSEQCDMTPSPSDSGISELEAALKDRDSELSYLRQTMEHNENDKEAFWENETKRLKTFYENQQREFVLKMKKMEQMLAMQQFQFKQHKMKHNELTNKLKEQVSELKHDNEIFRSTNGSLKNSERNLKDRVAYIEEQFRESQNTIAMLRQQLEESEWKVCERNGELALLKSQLKEANVEITMKEHAIVHLKHEHNSAETQIYQSLQENNQNAIEQQQKEQQQQIQSQNIERETELKQLNKIIILKDQVILALTNELAKLRKELSDLAIFHEYGEEPSGKYTRLKQQLDNLTDICNKTRKHAQRSAENGAAQENAIDETNLEVIMNCLKIATPLCDDDISIDCNANENCRQQKQNVNNRLAKMSADIQKFVYGVQNLPDVTVKTGSPGSEHPINDTATLDTLIQESANYAEEIAKLRKQLDEVRVNFEIEKQQWSEEKEKVLGYQKRLQAHYISMYQKLRNFERNTEV